MTFFDHSRRVVRDDAAERVGEVERASEVGGAPLDDGGREPAQHAVVVEQLAAGEPVEDAQPVGQHAHHPLRGERVGCRIHARDRDRALVGPEQSGDHRQRRRLAGAVRPDEAVERARRDREVDALDRPRVAEALRDAADDERVAADDRSG